MPVLFMFLLKVNAALLLFCAGYYLVLRRLTFYTLNRVYLMLAIVFATLYPKINLSAFFERHPITAPVQNVVVRWRAPARELIKPVTKPHYWKLAETVFWAGVLLLMLRLLAQLYSLLKLYKTSVAKKLNGFEVRVMQDDNAPFSFWKSIFINPSKHNDADLESILQHEQIHVNEWHTLDILLAELSTIFYWFNPGVWLMKKAVRENIEFITDRRILNSGADSKQYQYSLVNVSFAAAPQGLVNHFNISTIKKRIIMMNAKKSSKLKLTRYVFLVPAVIALLLVFSISKAAMVKRNTSTFKTWALTIKKIGKLSKPVLNAVTVAINKPAAVQTPKITAVVAVTKKQDTLRNGDIYIGTSGNVDSLNYVINGVKSNKAGFKALNSKNVASLDMLSPEQGKKLLTNLNSKQSVLFITTKDSEAGLKFKEKIDKVSNNHFAANLTGKAADQQTIILNENGSTSRTVSSWADFDKDSDTVILKNGNGTYNVKTRSHSSSHSIGGMNGPATVMYLKRSKNGKPVFDTIKTGNNFQYYVQGYPVDSNAAKSFKGFSSAANYNTLKFSSAYSFDRNISLNHISNKMIVINGKIATEKDLKKISAFDIDKMVLKTDTETKELYGDKAKNGVVFIITKK